MSSFPSCEPWEDGEAKVMGVQQAYPQLPARWDESCEDRIFQVLFDVFANRKHHATTLPAVKPTVAEFLDQPGNLTFRLPNYDPDFPVYDYSDILDVDEDVPELEALHRWSMVLHNQYPWDRSQVELAEAGQLADDDYVVAFHPRDKEVRGFLRRLSEGGAQARRGRGPRAATAGAAVPGDRRPAALLRAAAARIAGRGARRPGVQQRRPDPQHRLQLVADERRRDQRRRPASSSAGTAR